MGLLVAACKPLHWRWRIQTHLNLSQQLLQQMQLQGDLICVLLLPLLVMDDVCVVMGDLWFAFAFATDCMRLWGLLKLVAS